MRVSSLRNSYDETVRHQSFRPLYSGFFHQNEKWLKLCTVDVAKQFDNLSLCAATAKRSGDVSNPDLWASLSIEFHRN